MNRRKFVQFCMGAAATGATAASVWGLVRPLAIVRPGLGAPIDYIGAERTAGPAPRGVPFIPIFLNDDGILEGKPFVTMPDGTEVNVLDWYKFCGHAGAPGLSPDYGDDDNQMKFFIAEEKIAMVKPWYEDVLGKPMRPGDFPDVEFGAGSVWRSEGQSGPNVLTASVIRYPPDAISHVAANTVPPSTPIDEETFQWFLDEFTYQHDDGSVFASVSTFCTHFCCIPGYKESEELARPRDAWDKLFCTCHNSVYDPRRPVSYIFYPEPADEGGEDGGGGGGGH